MVQRLDSRILHGSGLTAKLFCVGVTADTCRPRATHLGAGSRDGASVHL